VFTPIATIGQGEIDLRVFADYVKGQLKDGAYLPRLPPLRYGARIQFHDDRFIMGLEATRHDDQNKAAAFEGRTPGYTMVNADFSWLITVSNGTEFDFFLRAANLSDEEARKHTSLVKEIAPLPGRNYIVGLRARF